MATKFFTISYPKQERPNAKYNPGSAFQTSDVNKLVGLSSGYVSLLSTDSTTIGLDTYEQFGILKGIPGTCTAKSTQDCLFTPIYQGDVLRVLMSSNISTSGIAVSSDIGKTIAIKGNGIQFPKLSTAGTLLTQGPIRGILTEVPSTSFCKVQIAGLNLIKMTTA